MISTITSALVKSYSFEHYWKKIYVTCCNMNSAHNSIAFLPWDLQFHFEISISLRLLKKFKISLKELFYNEPSLAFLSASSLAFCSASAFAAEYYSFDNKLTFITFLDIWKLFPKELHTFFFSDFILFALEFITSRFHKVFVDDWCGEGSGHEIPNYNVTIARSWTTF